MISCACLYVRVYLHLSRHLFICICLFACLPAVVRLSVYQLAYLYKCLSFWRSVCLLLVNLAVSLAMCLSICQSACCPFAYRYVCLTVCRPVCLLSVSLYVFLNVILFIYLLFYLSICNFCLLCICLSAYVFVCI